MCMFLNRLLDSSASFSGSSTNAAQLPFVREHQNQQVCCCHTVRPYVVQNRVIRMHRQPLDDKGVNAMDIASATGYPGAQGCPDPPSPLRAFPNVVGGQYQRLWAIHVTEPHVDISACDCSVPLSLMGYCREQVTWTPKFVNALENEAT